jgi:hypothetical protein
MRWNMERKTRENGFKTRQNNIVFAISISPEPLGNESKH